MGEDNRIIPPSDGDAEAAIISSLLLEPSKIGSIKVSGKHFCDKKNGVICDALITMFNSNKSVDAITLRRHLADDGLMERYSITDSYLINLMNPSIPPGHCDSYQDIVLGFHKRRQEIMAYQRGLAGSMNGEETGAEVIASLLSINDSAEDKSIEEYCEEFVDECGRGTAGRLQNWCKEWDDKIGRLESELVIIHAQRSTGKTALAIQWLTTLHKYGKRTPFMSIEMPKRLICRRLLCHVGAVNTFTMRTRGYVTDSEKKSSKDGIERIRDLKFIVSDGTLSIDDIVRLVIKENNTDGVDAVLIDNLLTIGSGHRKFESKTIMYDFFIKELKRLRDIIDAPIILLAHPNQQGQIAWSKDVENIADIIMYMGAVPVGGKINVRGVEISYNPSVKGDHIVVDFQKMRDGAPPIASLDFEKHIQTFTHMKWEI